MSASTWNCSELHKHLVEVTFIHHIRSVTKSLESLFCIILKKCTKVSPCPSHMSGLRIQWYSQLLFAMVAGCMHVRKGLRIWFLTHDASLNWIIWSKRLKSSFIFSYSHDIFVDDKKRHSNATPEIICHLIYGTRHDQTVVYHSNSSFAPEPCTL